MYFNFPGSSLVHDDYKVVDIPTNELALIPIDDLTGEIFTQTWSWLICQQITVIKQQFSPILCLFLAITGSFSLVDL